MISLSTMTLNNLEQDRCNMAKAPFVSLHNHTQIGSPLDGMNDVDQLFDQAASLDHRAIAITDHGTMTAHYDCYKASLRTGVKFIPGMEAYFAPDFETAACKHLKPIQVCSLLKFESLLKFKACYKLKDY